MTKISAPSEASRPSDASVPWMLAEMNEVLVEPLAAASKGTRLASPTPSQMLATTRQAEHDPRIGARGHGRRSAERSSR